ncbi:hypothetical protein AB3N02_16320 [Priestia aryabhattai]|uniref:hypothetical protein n=1 Tax=Priestia aryabhattai TaxID=412384 RepID=UPI0039A18D28
MNEKMMEVFTRNIIASLSINKRMLYQFIEGVEDHLAQKAETKEQFLTLLKEQSPHHQAANRFGMTIFETVTLMHEIEDEINEKLERKLDRYEWIDYTDYITYSKQAINSTRYYLIIS